jgi:hypothetical protein
MVTPGGIIFCDDIRTEASGKDFMIGIYGGNMVFQTLPVTVPNLWVVATVTFPSDEVVATASLRVVLPDGKANIQPSLQVQPFSPLGDGATSDFRMLTFKAHLQNLEFTQAGRLRVFAVLDGKDLRLGGLDIVEARSIVPPDLGALLSVYFGRATEGIARASKTKEEMADLLALWTQEISNVFTQNVDSSKWPDSSEALIFPNPQGVRAFFVRPVKPSEKVTIHGLPEGVQWTLSDRTTFSATFVLSQIPVPLETIRVEIGATGSKAKAKKKSAPV